MVDIVRLTRLISEYQTCYTALRGGRHRQAHQTHQVSIKPVTPLSGGGQQIRLTSLMSIKPITLLSGVVDIIRLTSLISEYQTRYTALKGGRHRQVY